MTKRVPRALTPTTVIELACGCQHDANSWIHQCPKDKAEHDELHSRAQADHKRNENEDLR